MSADAGSGCAAGFGSVGALAGSWALPNDEWTVPSSATTITINRLCFTMLSSLTLRCVEFVGLGPAFGPEQ